ncbi:aldehyde dehydrogenase family protein [Salibacterium aidingense]|uniref:aldehyde dehydrogenase family protein n=1 Tax=Salibacterium aidingense TaxID=384933 RepID=UPI003BDAADC0
MRQAHIWINNENRQTESYQPVFDPGDLQNCIGETAVGTAQDVKDSVTAAAEAFKHWKHTSLEERKKALLQGAVHLKKNINELTEIVSLENGVPYQTTKAELQLAISSIYNLTDLADSYFQPEHIEDEESWVRVEKDPKGVIAGIVPWNAPIVLTMQKLVPAVLSGNTAVFKPSPFASIGTSSIIQLMGLHLPKGVLNVVHGNGDVGAALTTHPLVRMVSFTGGGRTAKRIMNTAADSLKNIHFELGGNDAAVILDDADVKETAKMIVRSSFRKGGQYCFAVKRVYVPSSIYESFFRELTFQLQQIKVGHQLTEGAFFGPLNNKQQYDHVKKLIEEAEQDGATVIVSGQKLQPEQWEKGYYLLPALVKDIAHNHRLVVEEQFGPVLPIISYDDLDKGIDMANDTEFGLGSSVWSSDPDRGIQTAKRLEAGFTFINGIAPSKLGFKYMPFGGVKQSGLGHENSELVFHEYVNHHAIHLHK